MCGNRCIIGKFSPVAVVSSLRLISDRPEETRSMVLDYKLRPISPNIIVSNNSQT